MFRIGKQRNVNLVVKCLSLEGECGSGERLLTDRFFNGKYVLN